MSGYEPRADEDGRVHRPLFSATRQSTIVAHILAEGLRAAGDDPSAILTIEWDHRYCDDLWTLVYYNDDSDYYAI